MPHLKTPSYTSDKHITSGLVLICSLIAAFVTLTLVDKSHKKRYQKLAPRTSKQSQHSPSNSRSRGTRSGSHSRSTRRYSDEYDAGDADHGYGRRRYMASPPPRYSSRTRSRSRVRGQWSDDDLTLVDGARDGMAGRVVPYQAFAGATSGKMEQPQPVYAQRWQGR